MDAIIIESCSTIFRKELETILFKIMKYRTEQMQKLSGKDMTHSCPRISPYNKKLHAKSASFHASANLCSMFQLKSILVWHIKCIESLSVSNKDNSKASKKFFL
jgi:hypothetical protein